MNIKMEFPAFFSIVFCFDVFLDQSQIHMVQKLCNWCPFSDDTIEKPGSTFVFKRNHEASAGRVLKGTETPLSGGQKLLLYRQNRVNFKCGSVGWTGSFDEVCYNIE